MNDRAQSAVSNDTDNTLERIRRALEQMRYGAIGITVHEGRVVQIDITEKCRLTGN